MAGATPGASGGGSQATGGPTERIDSSSRSSGSTAPQSPNMPAFDPANSADAASLADNPMVKEMMNNPEMMRMAMQMMNGGQGQGGSAGAPNPTQLQEMMKNPSMQNMLSNPEMLAQSVNMMKNNPAMLEMLRKQMPGVEPETLVRGLEWLAALARYIAYARSFFSNKLIQLSFVLAFIGILFWYFG